MISRSFLVLVALALGLSFSSRTAYADSETISGCSNCNGYSFTANITSNGNGTFTVLYTITNNSGTAANPYSWSLTAFSNGNTVTAATPPTVTLYTANGTTSYTGDYLVNLGKSNNGNGNCNGNISDAFCVQETSTTGGPLLQQGQSLTFAFDVTCSGCSLMSSWDFMGSGNPASGTGNVYAITNWGTSTSMPEPSVALLYGSTVAAGLVFAWRSRPQRRSTKL